MEAFNSFVVAVCVACIFTGILHTLCPEGEISKSVKYILSLIFIITVIAAAGITLKKADFKINFSSESKAENPQLEALLTEQTFATALKNRKINFSQVTVCTDKLADGSIVISKVIIYSDCERSEILKALELESANYEVEIVNE